MSTKPELSEGVMGLTDPVRIAIAETFKREATPAGYHSPNVPVVGNLKIYEVCAAAIRQDRKERESETCEWWMPTNQDTYTIECGPYDKYPNAPGFDEPPITCEEVEPRCPFCGKRITIKEST